MNKQSLTPPATLVLGGGCFWCLEAVYELVDGVLAVESGYCNGHVEAPSYEQVCSGTTGHAEVVRVEFDASRIALREILEIFFTIHDPTQLNRQGPDVGDQYRSAIFCSTPEQAKAASKTLLSNLERAKANAAPPPCVCGPGGRKARSDAPGPDRRY